MKKFELDPENLPGAKLNETMDILQLQIKLMNKGMIAITIPEEICNIEALFW